MHDSLSEDCMKLSGVHPTPGKGAIMHPQKSQLWESFFSLFIWAKHRKSRRKHVCNMYTIYIYIYMCIYIYTDMYIYIYIHSVYIDRYILYILIHM